MINYFSRMLVNIKKGEKGSSPQKIILIFAGVLLGGFILANLTIASNLDLYATANGALVKNVLVADNTFHKAEALSKNKTFLMFTLKYPSIAKQLFAYGGDAMNGALGGNK